MSITKWHPILLPKIPKQKFTPKTFLLMTSSRMFATDLQKLSGNARHLQLTVKELHRHVKNACKPKKVKKHTVMHDPMTVSAELLKYLKQPAGTKLTKSEAMKLVSGVIKTTGLQNPENKRKFTPNKSLAKVLNMSPITSITFVELNKYLAHHYTPA
jgi:chromatin remodeling complex protein RSC6